MQGGLKKIKNKGFSARIFVLGKIFCTANFFFGPFEIRQFKTNYSDLKTDWGSPNGVQLFTECVFTFCCFTHFFVDSTCKQLAMVLSKERNPTNLSGDLTDDCVNILYLSLNKSPNRAMCTSL